jgi:hypothetical protein
VREVGSTGREGEMPEDWLGAGDGVVREDWVESVPTVLKPMDGADDGSVE